MTGIAKTAIMVAIFAAPIIADECSAGSLASMQDQTCDIGILRFNFDQVEAAASSFDNSGTPLPTPLTLDAANFAFTPLPTEQIGFGVEATGYMITSLAGPIYLNAPPDGNSQAIVALDFSVTPQLAGIDGAGVVGADITASGQGYGVSQMEAGDLDAEGRVSAKYDTGYYDTLTGDIPLGTTAQGSSILLDLYNTDGGADEWVGPSTTFLFFSPTPTPEANSLVLLAAVVGLCGLLIRRRASQ